MTRGLDPIECDVVIVGAGVAGATVAKTIAAAGGKRILILEAGRNTGMSADKYLSQVIEYHEASAKLPNSPYRDNPNVPQPSEASLRQIEPGVPATNGYLVQNGPLPFSSSYTRALGGTTLHWLGTTPRMLPNDFQLKSQYHVGVDWPIGYQDVKEYYERAESEVIGVSGNVADQRYPGIDEHYFGDYEYPMERVPSSYLDQTFAEHLNGVPVRLGEGDDASEHELFISNSPAGRNSTPRKISSDPDEWYRPVGAVGNAAEGHRCEGNSSCIPICPVQAKYNALKTLSELDRMYGPNGYVENGSSVRVMTQAVVTQVVKQDNGDLIEGLRYEQYQNEASTEKAIGTVKAKIYVLAAHAIENAKILLASKVANTSDQVGRNLMDHPLILTWGLMPERLPADEARGLAARTGKLWGYRGPGSTSGIPAFRDGDFRHRHSAFRVEIGNWGWSFPANSPTSTFEIMVDGDVSPAPTRRYFGPDLRRRLGEVLPRQFRMAWEMEQIPEETNRVTIDERYKDAFGNYRPVIDYDLPDYVKAGMKASRQAARQTFAQLGLTPMGDDNPNDFPFGRDYSSYSSGAPGYFEFEGEGFAFEGAGHVAGTHRMGHTADDSVVDPEGRSHDHPNLFLAGCGNMPTVGTSNPTLTMTALAIKTGDAINQEFRS